MDPATDLASLLLLKSKPDDLRDLIDAIRPIYPEDTYWNHSLATDFSLHSFDLTAADLLPRTMSNHFAPLCSTGDGNCLFNSGSILLNGTENLSSSLRLFTCLELYLNEEFYASHPHIVDLKIASKSAHGNYYTVESLYDVLCFSQSSTDIFNSDGFTPALRNEIINTSGNKNYCGLLHMMGLASVIGTRIRSVYPDNEYTFYDAYNAIIHPRVTVNNDREVVIFWTHSLGWKDRSKRFKSNHFVPLVEPKACQQFGQATGEIYTKKKNMIVIDLDEGSSQGKMENYLSKESQKNRTRVSEKSPKTEKDMLEAIEVRPVVPLCMPLDWYKTVGRNVIGNLSRDTERLSRQEAAESNNIFKGKLQCSMEEAISNIDKELKTASNEKKKKLEALKIVAAYLTNVEPIVKTQKINDILSKEQTKHKKKEKSYRIFERVSKFLPVCQVYINGVAYILADRSLEIFSVISHLHASKTFQINDYIESRIGNLYKDAIEYLDTKRDRDVLRGLLTKLTSIRFSAHLEGRKSREACRRSSGKLEGDLHRFSNLKKTSLTVCNDMTCKQQDRFHKSIIKKRKWKEMKVMTEGRGKKLKVEEYPDLPYVMECLFAEEGLEAHPRLTDDILYKSKGNTLTMRKAKEIILDLAPDSFTISLSSLYNYTQNYKVGTFQAKRHHHGMGVNACISLNRPSRTRTEKPVINLHWSSANVNHLMEKASIEADNVLVDSKDPKNIICADIAPVQNPGKTWKKSKGLLLDHEWNQSRVNAVTPSTHLFVDVGEGSELLSANSIVKVTRSGSAFTLINLSHFEPFTSFRSTNELLKMMTQPELEYHFRNNKTGKLVGNFLFVVDNGAAEQPASPLVQMLLVRLKNFLGLKSIGQVSYAEYNSKRNPVERVHAEENKLLLRHGPFSSTMIHEKAQAGSEEHFCNMEKMAEEVSRCLIEARFGGKPLKSVRGVKDEEYVFSDEDALKSFLSMSEASKEDSDKMTYQAVDGDILTNIQQIWGVGKIFERSYLEDYMEIMNSNRTRRDKYTFVSYDNPPGAEAEIQPIPDYTRWLESNGELHYLPFKLSKDLPIGPWKEQHGLFTPSEILKPLYTLFPEPDVELLLAISFLAWVPTDEIREYFQHLAAVSSEELAKDKLREKLKQVGIFAKSKEELKEICSKKKISIEGSKLDLGLRIASSDNIDLTDIDVTFYDGNLNSVPQSMGGINNLSIPVLRAILAYHNISHYGAKDELGLRVYLLRANRKHLIHYNVKKALLDLIHIVEQLICLQVSQRILMQHLTIKQRKFATLQTAELSLFNPRKMASNSQLYEPSTIRIPDNITAENLSQVLKPLVQNLRIAGQERSSADFDTASASNNSSSILTPYNNCNDRFFQIGSRVKVRWTAEEIGNSGWRPGWYTAKVQTADMENDSIKVMYISEPDCTYKIDVSSYLALGKLEFVK